MIQAAIGQTTIPVGPLVTSAFAAITGTAILNANVWITHQGATASTQLATSGTACAATDARGVGQINVSSLTGGVTTFRIDIAGGTVGSNLPWSESCVQVGIPETANTQQLRFVSAGAGNPLVVQAFDTCSPEGFTSLSLNGAAIDQIIPLGSSVPENGAGTYISIDSTIRVYRTSLGQWHLYANANSLVANGTYTGPTAASPLGNYTLSGTTLVVSGITIPQLKTGPTIQDDSVAALAAAGLPPNSHAPGTAGGFPLLLAGGYAPETRMTSQFLLAIWGICTWLLSKFSGITNLANWLRVIARGDSPDALAMNEVNATEPLPITNIPLPNQSPGGANSAPGLCNAAGTLVTVYLSGSSLVYQTSPDGGASWTSPLAVGNSTPAAGHSWSGGIAMTYLSEGYCLLAVTDNWIDENGYATSGVVTWLGTVTDATVSWASRTSVPAPSSNWIQLSNANPVQHDQFYVAGSLIQLFQGTGTTGTASENMVGKLVLTIGGTRQGSANACIVLVYGSISGTTVTWGRLYHDC